MKRTLLLMAAILVIGLSTWFLVFNKDDSSTLKSKDWKFAIENVEQIEKIFIANRKGEIIRLEKTKTGWKLNEKYPVRPNALKNLLETIQQVELKYIPTRAASEIIIEDIAINGVKVEIYGSASNLLKSYYVGGSTIDERGTHMLMEGSSQPYVIAIPHWEGGLRTRYVMSHDDWRSRQVFDVVYENITGVSITYPKQRKESFKIKKEGRAFTVSPYFEYQSVISGEPNQAAVEAFLMGFEDLGAEGFENNNTLRDSVTSLIPFCTISLNTKEGNEKIVSLFPIENSTMVDESNPGVVKQLPVERYFAESSTGDFILVQDRLFRKILRGYAYFFD